MRIDHDRTAAVVYQLVLLHAAHGAVTIGEPLPLGTLLLCSTALNLVLGTTYGIQRQQIWQLRHMQRAHAHLHEREAKDWRTRVLAEKQDQLQRE
jgi:hypothetical protein